MVAEVMTADASTTEDVVAEAACAAGKTVAAVASTAEVFTAAKVMAAATFTHGPRPAQMKLLPLPGSPPPAPSPLLSMGRKSS